jgi:hypothetical protein
MTPDGQSVSLSRAQLELLRDLERYSYSQGRVFPKGLRTVEVLRRHGLVRDIGQGWYEVTEAGRKRAYES